MPDTIIRLAQGACPLVAADVFTATVKTSIIQIDISNPTGSVQGVELKMNGVILFSVDMPATGGVDFHGAQVIEAGETINLVADSASCTYNISGVEIT